jgi:hypothetical protein
MVICATSASRAGRLPIDCVKMSARSCSSSAAVCPAAIACSNRSRASCLRSTRPTTRRSPSVNA